MITPEFLKSIRLEAGYTQQELADKIGTNRWTVINNEKGKQISGYNLISDWIKQCGYEVTKCRKM